MNFVESAPLTSVIQHRQGKNYKDNLKLIIVLLSFTVPS